MENRRREATRLEGFDYSQPAEYFVTICTKDRACVLGNVVQGVMVQSEAGRIVEAAWNDIPAHFRSVRADLLRVMPNHVHGIIEILDKPIPPRIPCRGGVSRAPTNSGRANSEIRYLISDTVLTAKGDETSPLQRVKLGEVIGYFKYRATKNINEANGSPGRKVFQRNYHDRIIRSDIERFYIERYIELNPLLWHFDRDNPSVHAIPIEELKCVLQRDHGLDEYAIDYLLERFTDHRA